MAGGLLLNRTLNDNRGHVRRGLVDRFLDGQFESGGRRGASVAIALQTQRHGSRIVHPTRFTFPP